MPRKKKTNGRTIVLVLILFAIIAIAGIGFYGLKMGWFLGIISVTINQDIIDQLETAKDQTGTECSITFSRNIVNIGDSVSVTLKDGKNTQCGIFYKFDDNPWVFETFITTNSAGYYSESRVVDVAAGTYTFAAICGECVTNQASLIVNPTTTTTTIPTTTTTTIPTWDVGDVVSSESGSGAMPASGGLGFEFHDLINFEVVPGGPRRLGARIYTIFDYVDQDMCYGMVQQEGMEWMFTDSDSVEWHVVDGFPQAHSVNLCPLNWNGINLWFLDFWKTQNIVGCEILYEWNVEIYVCE